MTTAIAAPALVQPEPVNKWLVTVSIAFGSLMAAIDASIVNVALPEIRGTVGATVEAHRKHEAELSRDESVTRVTIIPDIGCARARLTAGPLTRSTAA
jgi:hypothetical protein